MKPHPRPPSRRNMLVITGTPGTGKTTISKAIAKATHADYLSLTRFVTSNGLYSGIDRERSSKIVDIERTRKSLRSLISRGDMIIVDTHVADSIPRERTRKVIVLRCHPNALESRLRKKGWSANKVRENVLAEMLDACYMIAISYYGAKKVHQLDTSSRRLEKCVALAKKILQQQTSESVTINWIATLKRERGLERFLE
ncbi:MAG: AAA family ATPase [Candidatus Bathyarchaeia archaeon]